MGLLRLTGSPTLALIPGCLLSGAMAARFVVALLALASLCAASDLDCKELVKPLVLDSHSPVSMTIGRQAGRTVGGWVGITAVWTLSSVLVRFTGSGCSTRGRGTSPA